MKTLIKEEIYKYIQTQNMSKEETAVIDTYVADLINSLEPLFKLQEALGDKEKVKELSKLILKDLGDNIGQRNT